MEAITLLLVLSSVVYLIFFNPRLVKAILQFFILNLILSTFFLFGSCLLLFFLVPQAGYSLNYFNIILTWDFCVGWDLELYSYYFYLKLIMSFWLVTFLFKLTVAPFSIWIVTVYSSLPWIVLLIIMTAYKCVYFYIFLKIFCTILIILPQLAVFWTTITLLCGLISVGIGCLAFREQDLKTFFTYTTISQMGYILMGFSVGDVVSWKYAMHYLLLYCLQIVGVFTVLLLLQNKYNFTNLNQLYLVKYYNKFYYWILLILFFSFMGIPPLSGFFMKYFLLFSIYQAGFFIGAVWGLVAGFFMALIYFQIILQLMWQRPTSSDSIMSEATKKRVYVNVFRHFNYDKLTQKIIHTFLGVIVFITIGYIFCAPELPIICFKFITAFLKV